MLCQRADVQGAVRGHRQDSWPDLARDVPCHIKSCSGYKMGSWLGGVDHPLGISQWVVSSCIVRHLSFSWVLFHSFLIIFLFMTIIIIFYYCYYIFKVIKLLLFQPVSFTFLFHSPPHPTGRGEVLSHLHGAGLHHGCMVFATATEKSRTFLYFHYLDKTVTKVSIYT